MKPTTNCLHCEGQGYTEIRDCTGEIQRQETCSFCGGTGQIEAPNPQNNLTEIAQTVQDLVKSETAGDERIRQDD